MGAAPPNATRSGRYLLFRLALTSNYRDIDVFSASIAPGVSAPAVKGIDLSVFDPLLEAIKKTGKIKVFDVAECNPRFDLDNRTAKLAAYIIFNYLFD